MDSQARAAIRRTAETVLLGIMVNYHGWSSDDGTRRVGKPCSPGHDEIETRGVSFLKTPPQRENNDGANCALSFANGSGQAMSRIDYTLQEDTSIGIGMCI